MSDINKIIIFILFVPLLFVAIFSCNTKENNNRKTPDVPAEKVNIVRFEQLLCNTKDTSKNVHLDYLLKSYPVFTDIFFNQVIFPQNTQSIKLENLINNYCNSPAIQHLIDTTHILFPRLDGLESKLGKAFGYFHYYFPDEPIPRVFTYVSEFGIGTFTVDTRVLGIGLDFFLGTDYPYYDPAVFPAYMQRIMTPAYMPVQAIRTLSRELVAPVTTANMLDYMIHNGKTTYLASMLMPEEPLYLLNLYTESQMDWVQDHELDIWSYFLDLGYFYESDQRKFRKFVDPAPHSPGMPEEAPGRVANWIGYRIVESFMNHHPNVSVQDLANITDYQYIMDQSKYKPKRPE